MSTKRLAPVFAIATVAAASDAAQAHLVSTDLGPFYDGAAHTLITPEDLLAIAGLAILAAFSGIRAQRGAATTEAREAPGTPAVPGAGLLVALTGAWALGASAAFGVMTSELALPLLTPTLLLALGLLGLLRARVPRVVLWMGGALIGLTLGSINGAAARLEDGQWLTVLGMVTSVFAATALLLAGGAWMDRRAWSIVLRIGASWIAAIGLLMLGWALRSPMAPDLP